MTAPLREAVVGAWELISFSSRDVDTGAVSHPLGRRPRGLILYTPDGYMSAQLTAGPGASSPHPDYVAYGGRFHVDERAATIRHDVQISMLPELLSSPQIRHARLDTDRLTLSATAVVGATTTLNTLTWQRCPH